MPVKVSIRHNTTYSYDKPVALSPHILRLTPTCHSKARVYNYSLKISPPGHIIHILEDPLGNTVARVDFQGLIKELDICVKLDAEIEMVNPFDFFVDEDATNFPFTYTERYQKFLSLYLEKGDPDIRLARWVKRID